MGPANRFRFDDFSLDIGRRELRRGSEQVAVSKLSFRLLLALVQAAPNVVTHDDLVAKVWGPKRIVTPENLAKRIMILRRALGDLADSPRYIGCVRGVGYRLLADASAGAKEPSGRRDLAFATTGALRQLTAALAIALFGVIAAASSWLQETQDDISEPGETETSSVRLYVELVDGETDTLIWSDSYEGELTSEDMAGIKRELETSLTDEHGGHARSLKN